MIEKQAAPQPTQGASPHVWTKESVADAVRAWSAKYGVVRARRIRATDHALLMAVYEHWGSVAVLAESLGLPTFVKERVTPEESAQAGMAYIDRRPSGYWTPKRVMDAVRTRYQQGKSLRPADMRREDNGLYRAACRAFIRWQLLMKRLEIPKEAYGRERIWTQKRITEKLRAWSAAHGPVNYVALRRDEPALFSAVGRQPGGLEAAAKAAGVPFRRQRNQWTKAKIAATLRNRVKRGKPILAKAVAKERQCLYLAALRHFGTWREALQAAGLLKQAEQGRRYLRKDALAQAIREWVQLHGTLKPAEVKKGDRHLWQAVYKRYEGGFRQAAAQLGLPYGGLRPWSREMVFAEMGRRLQEGKSLNPKKIIRSHAGLYAAMTLYFGSWKQALQAYGLNPDEHRTWPKDRWFGTVIRRKLQERHKRGQPLSAKELKQAEPEFYAGIKRRYGNLRKALVAAGIEIKKVEAEGKQHTEAEVGN
jgi:hypothetical protein